MLNLFSELLPLTHWQIYTIFKSSAHLGIVLSSFLFFSVRRGIFFSWLYRYVWQEKTWLYEWPKLEVQKAQQYLFPGTKEFIMGTLPCLSINYLLLIQSLVKIQGLRKIQQRSGTHSHFRYAKMKVCDFLRSTHIFIFVRDIKMIYSSHHQA